MKILLKLRKEKGVTQKDLAEYLQISRQAYANYEAGNRNPDFETLIKISEYFEVSVDYLLGKDSEPQKEKPTDDGELSDLKREIHAAIDEMPDDVLEHFLQMAKIYRDSHKKD